MTLPRTRRQRRFGRGARGLSNLLFSFATFAGGVRLVTDGGELFGDPRQRDTGRIPHDGHGGSHEVEPRFDDAGRSQTRQSLNEPDARKRNVHPRAQGHGAQSDAGGLDVQRVERGRVKLLVGAVGRHVVRGSASVRACVRRRLAGRSGSGQARRRDDRERGSAPCATELASAPCSIRSRGTTSPQWCRAPLIGRSRRDRDGGQSGHGVPEGASRGGQRRKEGSRGRAGSLPDLQGGRSSS